MTRLVHKTYQMCFWQGSFNWTSYLDFPSSIAIYIVFNNQFGFKILTKKKWNLMIWRSILRVVACKPPGRTNMTIWMEGFQLNILVIKIILQNITYNNNLFHSFSFISIHYLLHTTYPNIIGSKLHVT